VVVICGSLQPIHAQNEALGTQEGQVRGHCMEFPLRLKDAVEASRWESRRVRCLGVHWYTLEVQGRTLTPALTGSTSSQVNTLAIEFPRRDWIYASTPAEFEIPPCSKCNSELQWSTFKGKCWCPGCAQDIRPDHFGVIDGPCQPELCQMLGIDMGTIDLRCMAYVPWGSPTWPYSQHFTR
jgi:hypothetical protein